MGTNVMPDVAAASRAKAQGQLDWVGMSQIEVPVRLALQDGSIAQAAAKAQAYVNLVDPSAKGIHMSRLYLLMDELCNDVLTVERLRAVPDSFLASQEGLSDAAYIDFSFDFLIRRPALKSAFSGWKAYPTRIIATRRDGALTLELRCDIPYSSTCPCSAALARQLIQNQFKDDFAGQESVAAAEVEAWLGTEGGIVATPHSQRSIAEIRVVIANDASMFHLEELIDRVEEALQTPVQTAVKREDEQEFARLNGQNLMFCEDAARRIQNTLDQADAYQDFWVRVNHLESLHAHDAVAVVTKGVAGGYQPHP